MEQYYRGGDGVAHKGQDHDAQQGHQAAVLEHILHVHPAGAGHHGHGHGAGGSGESVGGRGSDDGGQGYHIDVAHSQGDGGGDGIEHGGAHGVGGEVGCDDAQGGDDQDEDGLVHPGDQGGDVADKEVGDAHLLQRQGAADDQDGGIEDQGAPGHAAGGRVLIIHNGLAVHLGQAEDHDGHHHRHRIAQRRDIPADGGGDVLQEALEEPDHDDHHEQDRGDLLLHAHGLEVRAQPGGIIVAQLVQVRAVEQAQWQ